MAFSLSPPVDPLTDDTQWGVGWKPRSHLSYFPIKCHCPARPLQICSALHFIAPTQHMWSRLWKWTGCLSTVIILLWKCSTQPLCRCPRVKKFDLIIEGWSSSWKVEIETGFKREMLWRLSSEIFIWPAAALSIISTQVSSEVWPLCALDITYQMRQHGPVLDGRQFSNWREILNSGSDGMSVRHNKAPNSSKYLQYLAQWDCSRKSVSR